MIRTFQITSELLALITLTFFYVPFAYAGTVTIRGHVVDDNGDGVVGAGVLAMHAQRGTGIGDEHGAFFIAGVTPGLDTLRISAVGYFTMIRPVVIKGDSDLIADLVLTEMTMHPVLEGGCATYDPDPTPPGYAETHSKISYGARLLSHVSGRVVDPEYGHLPIVWAHVELLQPIPLHKPDSVQRYDVAAQADIGHDGRFVFDSLQPDKYFVRTSLEGYDTNITQVMAGPGAPPRLDIEMKHNRWMYDTTLTQSPSGPRPKVVIPGRCIITGQLSDDETNAPIPHAWVIIGGNFRGPEGIHHMWWQQAVMTDSEGRFNVNGICTGMYSLSGSFGTYETPNPVHVIALPDTIYTVDVRVRKKATGR